MTTHLVGEKTRFLPFNQGRGLGAGNSRRILMGIGLLTCGSGCGLGTRGWTFWAVSSMLRSRRRVRRPRPTVIFPRFHQWDSVRRLEADAKADGCGL